jgi:hypothetical protein
MILFAANAMIPLRLKFMAGLFKENPARSFHGQPRMSSRMAAGMATGRVQPRRRQG